jgi:hypothetical protein
MIQIAIAAESRSETWGAQETAEKRSPAFRLNDGGDVDRVTSRNDGRARGPIRNDARGRRGPYDRGHGHDRP